MYGDLISANLYRLKKGEEKCILENFYDESCPSIEIALDKRLTPAQNAQKYYQEYRKLDVAEKKLTELIAKAKEEIFTSNQYLTHSLVRLLKVKL